MKSRKPKPLTEAYLRKIAAYYENQPKAEAMADIDRLARKINAAKTASKSIGSKTKTAKTAKAKPASGRSVAKKTVAKKSAVRKAAARQPAERKTNVEAKAAYAVKPRA